MAGAVEVVVVTGVIAGVVGITGVVGVAGAAGFTGVTVGALQPIINDAHVNRIAEKNNSFFIVTSIL